MVGAILMEMVAGGFAYADSDVRRDVSGTSQEAVFGRAKWIGPAVDKLHFMSQRLTVFAIDFDLKLDGKSSASFIYGADDPRLMSSNFNIYNLENKPGDSYVKVKILSDGTIQLYRAGYAPTDATGTPLATPTM